MAHNDHFEELAALQALGIPLGGEAVEFARHLDGCSECKALIADLEAASTAFAAQTSPVAPRPAVRQAILRAVSGQSGTKEPGTKVPPAAKRGYGAWAFAIAATLALIFFVNDDARLRRDREELRSRTADLSSRLESAEKSLARRDLQARVLESEDVRMMFLGGKDPQPAARAKVFWSQKAGRGILVAGNLAPLPAGKQYELWVFAGAGGNVRRGLLRPGDDGVVGPRGDRGGGELRRDRRAARRDAGADGPDRAGGGAVVRQDGPTPSLSS